METPDQTRLAIAVSTMASAGYEIQFSEPEGAGEWLAEAAPVTPGGEPVVARLHARGATEVDAAEALVAEWHARGGPPA